MSISSAMLGTPMAMATLMMAQHSSVASTVVPAMQVVHPSTLAPFVGSHLPKEQARILMQVDNVQIIID